MKLRHLLLTLISATLAATAQTKAPQVFPPDESGYETWLRYTEQALPSETAEQLTRVHVGVSGETAEAALSEWSRAMEGFFDREVKRVSDPEQAGVLFALNSTLGEEAYQIEVAPRLRISGGSERGLLYGVFTALSSIQRGEDRAAWAKSSEPFISLRMLNHWDNLTIDPTLGSIERVDGSTIFEWPDLTRPNPRYEDYARMLASVGINGVALNNVNSDPAILSSELLAGVAALADTLRPWGIRVFITANFASPVLLDGVKTADPLDPNVQAWWRAKADEIYALIPDFGGFLVKADSEGRPGPGTYGRSHVDGARVMADALAPHGGIVIWRAFVYGRDISERTPHQRAADDVANHGSYEFMHLAGEFPDNVVLQIKCSVIDFQAWEPVHPLFGRMPDTRLGIEMDLAKQYKGYDSTIGWEGPYFDYILNHPMGDGDPPATIAEIVAGKAPGHEPGLIAGVANIHDARDWFGHMLNASTLYTYGRQAWNPQAAPEAILRDWAELTFGDAAASGVVELLDDSYDTQAKYHGLLGNHSLAELQHHYRPDPWEPLFAKKTGVTEHGIGFDRSSETGSAFLDLYPEAVAELYADPETCPTRFLLFFHHLPWDYEMDDGSTLIQFLYDQYYEAVEEVRAYEDQWRQLLGKIDLERWAHVQEKLAAEAWHAEQWRDIMCRYFLEVSGIPDEKGRFTEGTPESPHVRVNTGFWRGVQDYRARVQRERERIRAITDE